MATGVVVTFAATASDADGDALAYYWEFGDTNFGTNSPTAGKSWSTAGDYLVRCVVSDMKGGVGSRWLIVRVGSPTTFRITGNITDGFAPVQNARVYATTARMGYTDSDGNYAIVGLPAGAYTVNASLYGYTFAPDNFANTVSVGPNQSGKNFLATGTVVSPPNITTQPASQSVNPGASVTFTVVASGASPLTYQWRFNGVNISGATSSSYTKSNVQATNAGNYSAVVNNAYGSATSVNAVLTVNTPPVITSQPTNVTVVAGNSASFYVSASGSPTLACQWMFNGNNLAGASNGVLTLASADAGDAGDYCVVVVNGAGSITSSVATLTVLLPPQILVPPQSQRVVQGSPVTLGVSASGTEPLTFQWRVNGQAILGATNQSLNLGNVQPADAGEYDVVVSNPAGTETSPPASLAVSVPPRLNSPQHTNSTARFTLSGTAGDLYMVQSSTNLFDWADVSTVSNQSGNVLFLAPPSVGPHRFYRARLTE